MAKSLPIINAKFTEDELQACGNGECCQCGLCCFVFRVDVPSEPGNPDSPLMRKEFGQRCPQLVSDVRGRSLCLLQGHKKHYPSLSTCDRWSGDKENYLTGRSGYEDVCENASQWMLYPPSAECVEIIRDLIIKGVLVTADIRRECARWFTNTRNLQLSLKRYLMDFRMLPHDIFTCIGIRDQLMRRAEDVPFILADIQFLDSHPLYPEFRETYLS